ncbi:MAG: hypothetical protein GY722_27045 [bacterium]|nr:hypothetical protein [bacterium]
MSDEAMDDESMSDESMTDENSMSDEPMDDESMADEPMDDESMADESMADESMADESMADEHMPTTFTVTITNTSEGADLETPIAPGAFIVHTSMETLFGEGIADRGEGLESLAEDGNPSTLVTSLGALPTVSTASTFAIPDGATEPGPALPGSSYSFTFEAVHGDYLSFATMFVQSNDWFLAPSPNGISLFTDDTPLQGDITALVSLWDAGTEVDETPGQGENQAPRQEAPNTGDTQGAAIAAVDGYAGTISVTITAG